MVKQFLLSALALLSFTASCLTFPALSDPRLVHSTTISSFLSLLSARRAVRTQNTLRPVQRFRNYGSRHARRPRTAMSAKQDDSYGGQGMTLDPAETPESLVIFCHGLGDTAHGWFPVAQQLQAILPKTRFILPTAPNRPIKINMNMSMPGWADIYGLTPEASEDKEGMEQSAERLMKIVEGEKAKGIAPEKIVIGGFSQGGALSLYAATKASSTLGGVVALSGWMPLGKEAKGRVTEEAKKTPLMMCHGELDMVVSHEWGAKSMELVKELGFQVDWHSFPGLDHGALPQEIYAVGQWLKAKLV
mmetsp:Transcript_33318/g.66074  ORF Transcript_33318/g.66074 Transcript_33318/m.66074 type:complete len:304 (+) Transcript_33318:221-1132(+)